LIAASELGSHLVRSWPDLGTHLADKHHNLILAESLLALSFIGAEASLEDFPRR